MLGRFAGLLQNTFQHLNDGLLFAPGQWRELLGQFFQTRRRPRLVSHLLFTVCRVEQIAGGDAEDLGNLLQLFCCGIFCSAFQIRHHLKGCVKPLRKLRLSPSAFLPQRRQAYAERRSRFRCWSSCHIGRTISEGLKACIWACIQISKYIY